ncbi:hypothetical protein BDV96DRAFT_584119 [Lophiotrema nucula]|uniref:Rrn9 domain-containing protein n=1 Tax=Lophiotrema nucula TaxID=690887 RepID=A0A6A5YTF0_9PLEO|nr:hypothetical protein BDV96DRAFT_584119 [Lophiotrema nucula]
MSLFGGSSLASSTQSSSTDDESEDSITPPATAAAPDAQDAQLPDILEADDEDDSDYEDEDEDDDDDDDAGVLDVRPNRFKGKASTWRGYTEADRDIANSLSQIESGDLAAHLYNAHALKRRVRLPSDEIESISNWRSKDTWLKRGDQLAFTDDAGEEQAELVPFKAWTAWPLPPGIVPASNERFGRRRSNAEREGWSIGGVGEQEPGDELREEVLAVMLRAAKEKWESRESDIDSDRTTRHRGVKGRSTSAQSTRSASALSDFDIDTQTGSTAGTNGDLAPVKRSETGPAHLIGKQKRAYRRKPPVQVSKPAILADEERARTLLLPSTNSLLARIDILAAAIRRSRLNQFGHGAYSDTSGSEMITDGGSGSSRSRSRSRPRSKSVTSRGKATRSSSQPRTEFKTSRTVVSHKKGTQHADASSLDDDSASDFEGDRENKRCIRSKKRAPSKTRGSAGSDESPSRPGQTYSGLIDWSEVLGLASMTGWDEGAVARTAQRCAALFGEGMDFRCFDTTSDDLSKPVHFRPSTISSLDSTGFGEPMSEKRPYCSKDALRCPHTNCDGHRHDFSTHYRVVQHIMRQHGYDPRENDSDNEERTYGGVHIDGFLQLIAPKKGWIGRGRSKSVDSRSSHKRRKIKKEEDDGSNSSFEVSD